MRSDHLEISAEFLGVDLHRYITDDPPYNMQATVRGPRRSFTAIMYPLHLAIEARFVRKIQGRSDRNLSKGYHM